MISLHLIPMDYEGGVVPSDKWGINDDHDSNDFHEWRGTDGRGFYSVASALVSLRTNWGKDVFITGHECRVKTIDGYVLAATIRADGELYAALVGHFDDPADSTDYFEDAPIVAQDAQDGQGEGK